MRPAALVTAVLALFATLLVAAGPAAAADPPVNPTDGQITAAQQAQQTLTAQLQGLQAQAAQLQGQIVALQVAADAAVTRYQATTAAVVAAVAAADRAKAELADANTKVAGARRAVQVIAHDTYISGNAQDSGAALLFADNADVDFTLAASTYLAQRRDATLGSLTIANVAASNAETTRRNALAQAEALQARADEEQKIALASLDTANSKQAQLQATLDQVNQQAATASAQLSGLLDQRAAYDAYLAEVARKAAAAEAARQAAAAQAAQAAAATAAEQDSPVAAYAPPAPAASPGGTWAIPLRSYRISSGFGYRDGGFHYGLDLAAPLGTPIYAVGPGTVAASGPASGFGNWVVIRHADNSYSIYGHMRVLVARIGQQVDSSTLIAYVGTEGESSGPHLHFEVRMGSFSNSRYATDPRIWLARRGLYP